MLRGKSEVKIGGLDNILVYLINSSSNLFDENGYWKLIPFVCGHDQLSPRVDRVREIFQEELKRAISRRKWQKTKLS